MNSKELLAHYEQLENDLKDQNRYDMILQKQTVLSNLQVAIQLALLREHIATRNFH